MRMRQCVRDAASGGNPQSPLAMATDILAFVVLAVYVVYVWAN